MAGGHKRFLDQRARLRILNDGLYKQKTCQEITSAKTRGEFKIRSNTWLHIARVSNDSSSLRFLAVVLLFQRTQTT